MLENILSFHIGYQQEGESRVKTDDRTLVLQRDDSILIPAGHSVELLCDADSFVMSVAMATPERITLEK